MYWLPRLTKKAPTVDSHDESLGFGSAQLQIPCKTPHKFETFNLKQRSSAFFTPYLPCPFTISCYFRPCVAAQWEFWRRRQATEERSVDGTDFNGIGGQGHHRGRHQHPTETNFSSDEEEENRHGGNHRDSQQVSDLSSQSSLSRNSTRRSSSAPRSKSRRRHQPNQQGSPRSPGTPLGKSAHHI